MDVQSERERERERERKRKKERERIEREREREKVRCPVCSLASLIKGCVSGANSQVQLV